MLIKRSKDEDVVLLARIRRRGDQIDEDKSLDAYLRRCSDSGRVLFDAAREEADARQHKTLAPEHFLLAISKVECALFNELMQSLNLDPCAILNTLETVLNQKKYTSDSPGVSDSGRKFFSYSLKHAHQEGRPRIESTDFLAGLFGDKKSSSVRMFTRLGADREAIVKKIQKLAQLRRARKNSAS